MDIVTIFCAVVFIFSTLTGQLRACPRGFDVTADNKTCYFFSHDEETWVDALVMCQMLEGFLVEIESKSEYDYLRQQCAARLAGSRWTALNDKRAPSVWEWATSHRIYEKDTSFNMWAPDEPDNYHGEHCVLLDKVDDTKHHDYTLADAECGRKNKYICEYNEPTDFSVMLG